MSMLVKLKLKYRFQTGNVQAADGAHYGDYYVKKNGANGDHGRRRKRTKSGRKTYDPKKHVLVVLKSGKKRMVHLV